jgi:hypothetical protein
LSQVARVAIARETSETVHETQRIAPEILRPIVLGMQQGEVAEMRPLALETLPIELAMTRVTGLVMRLVVLANWRIVIDRVAVRQVVMLPIVLPTRSIRPTPQRATRGIALERQLIGLATPPIVLAIPQRELEAMVTDRVEVVSTARAQVPPLIGLSIVVLDGRPQRLRAAQPETLYPAAVLADVMLAVGSDAPPTTSLDQVAEALPIVCQLQEQVRQLIVLVTRQTEPEMQQIDRVVPVLIALVATRP